MFIKLSSEPIESSVHWAEVESRLGFRLPDDYKKFIETYGTGEICNFLQVLNPAASAEDLNLEKRAPIFLAAIREHRDFMSGIKSSVTMPAIFPEPGGIFPWGRTDNGDVLYWKTDSKNPNQWTIALSDGRVSEWEFYHGNMTSFLEALLSREFISGILTDDEFPPGEAIFTHLAPDYGIN